MPEKLEHSIEGNESLKLFYNAELTVFLEGDEEFHFWKKLFELANINAHFVNVHGSSNLKTKTDSILNKKAKFVVAYDAHYDVVLKKSTEHEQIIRTYGHSFENSLFTTSKINSLICNIGSIKAQGQDYKANINSWKKEFSEDMTQILIYDIANNYYDKGLRVTNDSCEQFLENNTSLKVDKKKVSDHIDQFKQYFTEKEISTVKNILNKSTKSNWFNLKGKLLKRGVRNVIYNYLGEIDINRKITDNDLIPRFSEFDNQFQDEPDVKAVVEKIKKLKLIFSPTASQT